MFNLIMEPKSVKKLSNDFIIFVSKMLWKQFKQRPDAKKKWRMMVGDEGEEGSSG